MREGYKKTEVGIIPEDWEVKSTEELFEFSGGMSISIQQLDENGVNYLHYGDIHKRKESILDLDKDKKWMPKLNQKFDLIKDDVKLNTGDVVFADASEDYEGIGKSIVVLNTNNDEVVSGLHTIVAKGSNEVLDTYYKRYCFSTENVRKQFRRLATGTSVYGISRENIKKIKILVPPLKEQEKIAEILSTVDSQIDDTEKLIEKSKELKKGLMQKLLTKGIGHSEFKKTEVGEIPIEWEVKKLEDISTVIMGQSPRSESYNEEKNGIPFFQGNSEFGRMYPTIKKWCSEPSKIAEPLDILISVRAPVGAVNLNKCQSCIGRGLAAVRSNDNSDYMYLYYILSYSEKVLNSTAQGSTFTAINSGDLKGLKIAIPKLEEQQNIGQILLSIDNEIEVYENKKQKLEELKKGLMKQLLTGKIRVRI